MAPRDPNGLATAADLAAGEDRAAPWKPEARQASLFGLDVAEPDGVGAVEAPEDAAPGAPRRPGRPPGSRNRSTEEWRRYLLSRYRSPLIGLAELAQANPHDLADDLTVAGEGGTVAPIEALRVIAQAQAALAPYVHQRMPQALDAGEGGLLQVFIGGASGAQMAAVEGVQYQPLGNTEGEPSE